MPRRTINESEIVTYCVIMANEPVDDVRPFVPRDLISADRNNIPLTDRQGGSYSGRVVKTGSWDQCQDFKRRAFAAGQLSDGTAIPIDADPFAVAGLCSAPRAGRIQFADCPW